MGILLSTRKKFAMTKRLIIGKIDLSFTFRHKWDSMSKSNPISSGFKKYELGIWFRCNKVVGKTNFRDPNKWGENTVNQFTFGVRLLVCKIWFTVDRDAMRFETKDK